MKKLKSFLKTKKGKISIAVVSILLVVSCIGGGYVYSENQKKTEALNAMKITFNENFKVDEVEYGSEVEVKDLVKVENGEIKEYPTIDTTKIGEQSLKFIVSKDKYSKEIEQKINIIDTKAPDITFEADSNELTVGDEYDIKSNVTSVKDPIDGDVTLVEDAKSINEKATEEYKELKTEEITDETKVADKTLSEFAIVDGDTEDSDKTLYLKNCYYIDGTVDTATAGDYSIKIVAVDKNGTKSEKEFTVSIKEKVVEPTPQSSGGSNGGTYTTTYTNGSTGGSTSSGGSSTPAPAAPKGKDYLLSYASGKVGQTGWNCQDYVEDALRSAGYFGSGQNYYSAGYQIAWQDLTAGDVLTTTSRYGIVHVFFITSAPTINEYGVYTWNTLDGGVGPDQSVIASTFQYDPNRQDGRNAELNDIRRY